MEFLFLQAEEKYLFNRSGLKPGNYYKDIKRNKVKYIEGKIKLWGNE